MQIDVTVDDTVVRAALGEAQRQAPFALALALSNVTKDAQAAIRQGYRQRFQLRRPDFIEREGAKITQFATKAKPEAILEVTAKAGFLTKFEDGGEKRPKDGKAIAIPVAVRRSKSDIVPLSQRPPALYASKGAQAGRIFSKGGKLLQRVGRGAKAVTRVLYIWKASVRVDARLRFVATANETVDKSWRTRAVDGVDRALATMR